MARSAGDPRGTQAWKALRERVFAEETHCWWCGEWVDQDLDRTHRMSRTVDHIVAIARGGAGIPDRSGVRLAHRSCNGRRAHRVTAPHIDKELSVELACI